MLLFGRLDPTDYLDVYGIENPLTGFQNFVFTANPTMALPNEGSLGAVAGAWLTDNVYLLAGFADANGVPTESGFETFTDESEFFKHVELGWTPSFERRYLDKLNLLFWHVDEREEAGIPDAWGLAFTLTQFVEDRWMPFFRAGWSEGEVALLEATAMLGLGYSMREEGDLVALGLNWGRPPNDDSEDQFIGELFYRFQLAENLQITPDLQLVVNPANNPEENVIWVFGIRARLTF